VELGDWADVMLKTAVALDAEIVARTREAVGDAGQPDDVVVVERALDAYLRLRFEVAADHDFRDLGAYTRSLIGHRFSHGGARDVVTL
jgi:hypothetical protein